MKDKEAKFFCEYCDTEVPRNARFCPKCGHFFLSVRCPMCGLTGDQDDFTDGCPACGYAFGGNKPRTAVKEKETLSPMASRSQRKKAGRLIDSIAGSGSYGKKARREDALPLWMYFAASGVLVVLIMVVFSRM